MLDWFLRDEAGRIAAVDRLAVLDTPPEVPFEKIVDLIRTILNVPMATVTLVDRDRQWFLARRGIAAQETPRAISFCTHTIQQRDPLLVPDAHLDPRFMDNPLVQGDPRIRSYAGVPLRTAEGYNVGALCAIDTRPRTFSDAEVNILVNFANIVTDELELRLIAQRDHLTGALTRRGFVEQAAKQFAAYTRHGRPGALIMLDVDHFKTVNDSHGHAAGDQVLRQLAELCSSVMRPNDAFGRLGGEEFALLLPDAAPAEASAVAERFREMIEVYPFEIGAGRTLQVTVSLGVASLDLSTTSVDCWLAAADTLLYRAKQTGRNRYCTDALVENV
ncbi:GGDEF domain-containing protein [Glacieibacterium megasporae]|uniref:GGDEF domain-containing protein n=1 Tax=Glacieibacterium megasporae TaxID=2835787 RepID=UPI001C1DCF35|nr:sensor domain-containing diguanylate cyclase [Polymorphobacter megasporae]UAJ12315.1 sensor domain-containing diguanylate cyclase [Polymorphobacter megasporae]